MGDCGTTGAVVGTSTGMVVTAVPVLNTVSGTDWHRVQTVVLTMVMVLVWVTGKVEVVVPVVTVDVVTGYGC